MDLGEKFDLPDAAAPAFQVIARANRLTGVEMVADAQRYRLNVPNGRIVERASPHKGPDIGQKLLAELNVTRAGPRPDEGSALPRQRLRLVIAFGGLHRQYDGRHFR